MAHDKLAAQVNPVVKNLAGFDRKSGTLVERALFNNRLVVILICALVTIILGFQATKLELNASFEKMIPTGHPFIINYLDHKDQLSGLGNAVQIAVENRSGSIYDAEYMSVLEAQRRDIPNPRRRSRVHEISLDTEHPMAWRHRRRAGWRACHSQWLLGI